MWLPVFISIWTRTSTAMHFSENRLNLMISTQEPLFPAFPASVAAVSSSIAISPNVFINLHRASFSRACTACSSCTLLCPTFILSNTTLPQIRARHTLLSQLRREPCTMRRIRAFFRFRRYSDESGSTAFSNDSRPSVRRKPRPQLSLLSMSQKEYNWTRSYITPPASPRISEHFDKPRRTLSRRTSRRSKSTSTRPSRPTRSAKPWPARCSGPTGNTGVSVCVSQHLF